MVVSFFSTLDVVEWIALSGGGIGVLGGLAGIAGAFSARRGNQIAEEARGEAKAANKLSSESNAIAQDANRIAGEANTLSEEANSLVQKSVELETERHDVRWDCEWASPGEIVLVNTGDDEALDVKATLTVNGRDLVERRDRVSGGDKISFSTLAGKKLVAQFASARKQSIGDPSWQINLQGFHYALSISHHAVWKTALGKPREASSDETLSPASQFFG